MAATSPAMSGMIKAKIHCQGEAFFEEWRWQTA
jgi:hypothetical protein